MLYPPGPFNTVASLSVLCEMLKKLNQSLKITNHNRPDPNMIMGLSSQTPRVSPGIGWEIHHFGLPKGVEFTVQFSSEVGEFSI